MSVDHDIRAAGILLHTAIEARIHEAHAEIARFTGAAWRAAAHDRIARRVAESAAHLTDTLPPLFASSPVLAAAWDYARRRLQHQRRHAQIEKLHRQYVEARLAAGDWSALGLPYPAVAVERLLAGETLRIEGHSLCFEPQYPIVWLTNAYGVDSALGHQPDLATITHFLTHIARRTDDDIPTAMGFFRPRPDGLLHIVASNCPSETKDSPCAS